MAEITGAVFFSRADADSLVWFMKETGEEVIRNPERAEQLANSYERALDHSKAKLWTSVERDYRYAILALRFLSFGKNFSKLATWHEYSTGDDVRIDDMMEFAGGKVHETYGNKADAENEYERCREETKKPCFIAPHRYNPNWYDVLSDERCSYVGRFDIAYRSYEDASLCMNFLNDTQSRNVTVREVSREIAGKKQVRYKIHIGGK